VPPSASTPVAPLAKTRTEPFPEPADLPAGPTARPAVGPAADPAVRTAALSPREREVLALLADGATYGSIARTLELSPHTVDTYLRRLRAKTGSSNRTQLVMLALRLGLR
jgi:DNA-binding CsgD family transcriptional regulator